MIIANAPPRRITSVVCAAPNCSAVIARCDADDLPRLDKICHDHGGARIPSHVLLARSAAEPFVSVLRTLEFVTSTALAHRKSQLIPLGTRSACAVIVEGGEEALGEALESLSPHMSKGWVLAKAELRCGGRWTCGPTHRAAAIRVELDGDSADARVIRDTDSRLPTTWSPPPDAVGSPLTGVETLHCQTCRQAVEVAIDTDKRARRLAAESWTADGQFCSGRCAQMASAVGARAVATSATMSNQEWAELRERERQARERQARGELPPVEVPAPRPRAKGGR